MPTSTVIAPNVSLTDNSTFAGLGTTWSFDASGRVTATYNIVGGGIGSKTDTLTGTDALAVVNNGLWRHAGGMWWSLVGNPGGELWWYGPQATIPSLSPSDPGTSLQIGDGHALVDTYGNLWWTTPAQNDPSTFQVVENWQVDKGTAKVSALYFDGQHIWQQAQNDNGWWEKSGAGYDGWGTQQNYAPHTYGATLTWQSGWGDPSSWSMTGATSAPMTGSMTNGVPQVGDYLVMNTGSTMNVSNTNLANDVLHLNSGYSPGIATFNLYDNSSVNLGGYTLAGGNATVAITTVVPHVDVSLHHSSSGPSLTVTGGISAGYGFNVTGGNNDVLTNNGSITLSNSLIDARLDGTGTYNVTRYHDGSGNVTLDGNDNVGAGLTFNLGSSDLGFRANLTIDSPILFAASLNITAVGSSVILKGITSSSFVYDGNVLTLYNGDTLVGHTFKLSSALPLTVQSAYGDTTIDGTGTNLSTYVPPPIPIPTIKSVGPDSALADNITNAATLTLTGTAEANSTVTMYDGDKLGTVAAAANGSWSFITGELDDGKHDFTATATDGNGTSAPSNAMMMTTDTVAPAVPTISQPGSVTPVMVLNGTADANSTVTVFDNGSAIGTAAVSNGMWSFTTGSLADGDHKFTETATDVAGNRSAATSGITITESTPTQPTQQPQPANNTDTTTGSQPPQPVNYSITDTTTGQSSTLAGDTYQGPVAGLQSECIYLTHDNINIAANIPNVFIHSGEGQDAIQVLGGTNVLDGSTGSNFLVGGSGTDTFFVDDRGPSADIWSTVVGFHSGDSATVWGVTPDDFKSSWVDNQGAGGYTGLTLHATADGKPTASLTLAGFTTNDMNDSRLSISFGHTADLPGLSGSSFMMIHGN